MNRRQALEKVGYLLGGTMIGSELFLSKGFAAGQPGTFLTGDQIDLLNEVGETILPETTVGGTVVPGAGTAEVGKFMESIVRDCYTAAEQRVFLEGLEKLEAGCRQKFGKPFRGCTAAQRLAFLTGLDEEHRTYMQNRAPDAPVHYFRMFKELTLAGYFTSEPGATKFLKYNPAPGRYDGCTTEKPWL